MKNNTNSKPPTPNRIPCADRSSMQTASFDCSTPASRATRQLRQLGTFPN